MATNTPQQRIKDLESANTTLLENRNIAAERLNKVYADLIPIDGTEDVMEELLDVLMTQLWTKEDD